VSSPNPRELVIGLRMADERTGFANLERENRPGRQVVQPKEETRSPSGGHLSTRRVPRRPECKMSSGFGACSEQPGARLKNAREGTGNAELVADVEMSRARGATSALPRVSEPIRKMPARGRPA
jgi:hypothetical protein